MHVDDWAPLYNDEAFDRWWNYYPPPYYYEGEWVWATPWLYYDGNKHGGYQYSLWESIIVERMNQPAPMTITMWGNYTQARGTGTVYAKFRNDSTETITGRVIFVITEDSIYYEAPIGDNWHNHVARDYVPTQHGQIISILAGDSVTVSQQFTIHLGWNVERCNIITWIQNDIMQPDSTKEIWQGGFMKVTELAGIETESIPNHLPSLVTVIPNPCTEGVDFLFNLPQGVEYSITLYDVVGRKIGRLHGVSCGDQESVKWDRKDDKGQTVNAGIYLYRFASPVLNTTGKLVVK
jgi:hypothetical protein